MRRVQIQFTDEQIDKLKLVAKLEDKSIAQIVREATDHALIRHKVKRTPAMIARAKAFAGSIRADRDLARNHDKYFAQAIEERWQSSSTRRRSSL
ncbi:MAG: hypothetical protein SFV18_03810 [Bryobacteraceae bacterium]|nr:hypothetical protein [Bryobacteraceae bacterium]